MTTHTEPHAPPSWVLALNDAHVRRVVATSLEDYAADLDGRDDDRGVAPGPELRTLSTASLLLNVAEFLQGVRED